MAIIAQFHWRALSSWWLWFVVAVAMLLLPWRISPMTACAHASLLPATAAPADLDRLVFWQSPNDPLPWFSRRVRAHWQCAWAHVQRWLRLVLQGLQLAVRLWSCRTLADIIAVLTRHSVARYLGALPVLYLLLDQLQIRTIINRYCPTESPVDHGAVALVLILNRLVAPRPLYRVMDWLASTLLSDYLGIPAAKFNDDRLGRTLDALAEHAQAIWQAIASQALVRYQIDLSVLFYDLTALVMTGAYADSDLVDYGFAHNTPSDKQKVKVGAVATRDGGLPLLFQPWAGRTADKATVQKNMDALRRLLAGRGWNTQQVLIVGDSANLNSELALAYADHQLKYLAGLPLLEKAHRTLVLTPTEAELRRLPLTVAQGPTGYWGWECPVPFAHQGRQLVHRGLVVLAGPMRTSLRRQRADDFHALFDALRQVQGKIGQKRYRTALEVQRRAETQLRHSPVGQFVRVAATADATATITLHWWVDRDALAAAMRADGRYLLVTNDPNLTPTRMLGLYRDKDVLEKRCRVLKQDLRVRPLFVHRDERLCALLLINLLALLAYSLLERQARQQGLTLTAHRILECLSRVHVIEIEAWDGRRVYQLSEVTPEQAHVIRLVWAGVGQSVTLTPQASERFVLEDWLAPPVSVRVGPARSQGGDA